MPAPLFLHHAASALPLLYTGTHLVYHTHHTVNYSGFHLT